MHGIKLAAPAAAALLLSACMSVGGPGVSTYYECDRGTRLKVDFMGDRALVSVNGGRPRSDAVRTGGERRDVRKPRGLATAHEGQ